MQKPPPKVKGARTAPPQPSRPVPLALWMGVALFPLLFAWPLFLSQASGRAKVAAALLLVLEIGLMFYAMEGARIFEALRMLRAL